MTRTMLKSKIHRVTVTDASLDYIGSITLDSTLMKAADILPNEQVHVLNLSNGARFETYAIEAEADSGTVCVNGAAARLVSPGDKVIILTYTTLSDEAAKKWSPSVIFVDEKNRIVVTSGGPGSE
ncbi:MAG: aspartate 1-decarboxylase [Acidimicrobiia bacterium]